jgi:hypothetical protein
MKHRLALTRPFTLAHIRLGPGANLNRDAVPRWTLWEGCRSFLSEASEQVNVYPMIRRFLPVVLVLASTVPAFAQSPGGGTWLNIAGGGTRDIRGKDSPFADGGGAVAVSLSIQTLRRLFITVTPMDSDGTCRESNGRFAEKEKCLAVSVDYAFTTDVAIEIPSTPLLIGAGFRYNNKNNPWFVVTGFQKHLSSRGMAGLRLHVGPDSYLSGLFFLSFRIGGS